MPLDLSEEFERDPKAEVEGVWENIGGDAELLIAAWENPEYMKALRSIPRSLRRRLEAGRITPEEDQKLMAKIMAQTVLLGWKNVTYKGKDLPYTQENAEMVLVKVPRFYSLVVELAQDEQRFLLSEKEKVGKNSKRRLDGS